MIQKLDLVKRSFLLAFFYSIFWWLLHFYFVGATVQPILLPAQFVSSFLIYFTLNGFFISFNYYSWGAIVQIFHSLLYILPTFQLMYFQTYKVFLEQQNLSLLIREPMFLIKIISSEMSVTKFFLLIFAWFASFVVNTFFLHKKIFLLTKKPFDFFNNKWVLVLLALTTALQVKWCLKHDTSQLMIRPIYPITLFALISIIHFIIRSGRQWSTKAILIFLMSFNLYHLYAFNLGFMDLRSKMVLDAQFYRALFGAFFVQTAFGDMKQDDIAKEKYDRLPQIKMDYNILLVLNDTQRWDKMSSNGFEKLTDNELDWLYKKSFLFRFPIAPANFTDTSVPAIMTGLGSDQDVKKIKGSLPLWDYFSKTANTFFISTQDITWSKLNLFYQSYGQKFIWSATAQKSYRGNPEDASDKLSYDFISEYLPKLKEPYVGVWQTFASHYPYTHPPEFARYQPCNLDRSKNDEGFNNCYLNGVVYSTHLRSELFKKLNLDNTIIIMTSDHGEGIGEHGVYFHGVDYHQEMVKVPLIIYIPEKIQKRLPEWALKNIKANTEKVVSLTDIVPTMLHMHELLTQEKIGEEASYYSGRSLFTDWNYRVVFSSHCFPQYRCYSREILFADDDYYLIFRPSVGFYKIYETWKDLKQNNPLDVRSVPREKLERLVNEAANVHSSGKSLQQVWDQY